MKEIQKYIQERVVIDESQCWNWALSCNQGYGIAWDTINKNRIQAHRLAYRAFIGKIPDGFIVMHKCDNPKCCNPAHLKVATQRENVWDMHRKGRFGGSNLPHTPGEKHGRAKMTEAIVRQIRASSKNSAELAKELGLSKSTVWAAKTGKTWRHLK